MAFLIKEEKAMQINRMGVRITDAPGIDDILVQPNTAFEHGVAVEITRDANYDRFTIAELNEHIEALTAARDAANEMAQLPVKTDDRGPWDRLEDVPIGIDRVWDRDNDHWDRATSVTNWGAWVAETGTYSGPATNQKYGPFRIEL